MNLYQITYEINKIETNYNVIASSMVNAINYLKENYEDLSSIEPIDCKIKLNDIILSNIQQNKTITISENNTSVTVLPDSGYDSLNQITIDVNIENE